MTLKTLSTALAFSIVTAAAHADSIGFDDVTVGSTFGTGEILDNDYASQGVNFLGGWEILNNPPAGLSQGIPTPPNVILLNIQDPNGSAFLDILFDYDISSFGAVVVADYVLDWTIDYYKDGSLISSEIVTNGDEEQESFLTTGLSVNRVTFSAPRAGVIDSLTFTPAVVPLPAGGLLLLSGLAGVAALKRRKKHSA